MNFMDSISNKAKDTLLQSIAALLDKNPQKNLPKIIKLSKLLPSDKSSVDLINNFELSYKDIPEFKTYVDDFLLNTDYRILKNFIVNILGSNLNSYEKNSNSKQKPHSLIINRKFDNNYDKLVGCNELEQIIIDSKKIGVFTFIISGYEPSTFNNIYDIYEKYKDCLFIPVTKENNINEISCMKILKCKNVIPLLQYKNINTDILRKNGIPSFDTSFLQDLLKKLKLHRNLSNIQTFSLELNDLSQKKLIPYSLLDLLKTNVL